MKWKINLLLIIFCFAGFQLSAQETSVYQDANEAYKQGMYFYKEGLFGHAEQEFQNVLALVKDAPEGTPSVVLRDKAELYHGFSAIRLDHPDGEQLVLDFIQKHDPSGVANLAKFEMGNYYYNNQEFQKALDYYIAVDPAGLSNDEINDLKFRQSYAFFVRKKFKQAQSGFRQIKEIQNQYYYPSNYYYGVCAFFEDDYDTALASFQKVNKSKKYSKVVPYYICQIYFAKEQYEELIAYAEPLSDDRFLKYSREINQLIGQSYFELGNYAKALPYLSNYIEQAGTLTEKEVYQLAYTQYQTGAYEDAIENFEQLRDTDTELGQNALYNLAGSYLKTGKKNTARSAFLAASKMPYDAKIQEDSKFSYAKLSYELGYDREAINTLLEIKPGSTYYAEAQDLMGDIFLNTRDFARSLEIIEGLSNRTEKIDAAYQKVAYYRGVQLYYGDENNEAKELFTKAAMRSYDMKTKALANYWLGEIAYNEADYDGSLSYFGKYQSIAKTLPSMPDESSIATSNYAIAYNYWKKKDYQTARGYFRQAIDGIKARAPYIEDSYIKNQLLNDAILRAGDTYFKANRYENALTFYAEVIDKKADGFDYALFQKAIILGLQKKSVDKILELENIYQQYPNSYYADDAMFELGNTYLGIGRFDNAAETFLSLLDKYRTSEYVNPALLKLGLIYVNTGQNEKGLEFFKRVFANNPDPEIARDALNGIEEIYIAMDDTEGYFAFLESIPGYNVTTTARDSITYKAAETQYGNGDYVRAAKGYTTYINQFPNGTYLIPAYFKRAESYYAVKDYRKSLTDYEFLLERLPNRYAEVSAKKAALVSYNILEDFGKAYGHFSTYGDLASNDDNKYEADLWALRSAYRSQNKQGVYTYANLVTNNSKSAKSEKAEAQYYLAKLSLEDQQLNQARQAFNQVIALTDDERSAEARYQIAYIYYLERDLETAKELALTTNSEIQGYEFWLAKSVLLLADIFVEEGDTFNARAALESIVENYSGDEEILNEAKAKLERLDQMSNNNTRFAPATDPNADLELDDPIDDQE